MSVIRADSDDTVGVREDVTASSRVSVTVSIVFEEDGAKLSVKEREAVVVMVARTKQVTFVNLGTGFKRVYNIG